MAASSEEQPPIIGKDYIWLHRVIEPIALGVMPAGAAVWELSEMTTEGSAPDYILKTLGGLTMFSGGVMTAVALFGGAFQARYTANRNNTSQGW